MTKKSNLFSIDNKFLPKITFMAGSPEARGSNPDNTPESSPSRGFVDLLEQRQIAVNSLLCVGLDSDYTKIPIPMYLTWGTPILPENYKTASEFHRDASNSIIWFNYATIDATHPYVCAYKPNVAFYEEHGPDGWRALGATVSYIKKTDPTIPVILDGKRTDIGNTNIPYARMAFDLIDADAITVNPYFGGEALEPFLERTDKGVIVMCRTSNQGAKELQDLIVKHPDLGEVPLYLVVAHLAETQWNKNGNVCLVVGATYPEELREVRRLFSGPILVPGLGTQGRKPEDLPNGFNPQKRGIIANNSRGIIFKSGGPDFAKVAGEEASKWCDAINVYR